MHLFFHLHISKKPFKLAVRSLDANDVGSVLLHVGEDGVEYPLSYSLKKFDVLQKPSSTIGKEALALVSGFEPFLCLCFRWPIVGGN